MEIRHLRTFVVAAETLNITAAARQLGVTQPALSRQIRELEEAAGHALFIRHPGGLRLTAAGEVLKDHGAKALAAFDEALRAARGEGAKAPSVLRVGYYGTMGTWSSVLAPAMEKLARKFPAVTCSVAEMTCAQLVGELREGRMDVAVLGPGDHPAVPGVTLESVCQFPAMVLAPINHRLAKKRSVAIEELRDEEIIGLSPESSPGRDRAFIAACRAAGFTPNIVSFGSSIPEAISAGIKRMGVGIAGNFAMNMPYPGVVYVKLKPPGVMLDLYAAYVQESAPARCLGELIGAEARRAVARTQAPVAEVAPA